MVHGGPRLAHAMSQAWAAVSAYKYFHIRDLNLETLRIMHLNFVK